MTTVELLKAAKHLLETQGRCRNQYIRPDGALCPAGALLAAQLKGGEPVSYQELRDGLDRRQWASGLFYSPARQLRRDAERALGFNAWSLVPWGDSLVSDEEVLARFDQGIAAASTKEESCP